MLPLNNIKVLIPRPIGKAEEFSEKLIKLGATPIIFPLIKVEAINTEKLKSTFSTQSYDWIIFTSTVAVEMFFNSIKTTDINCKIAVVGTSTKKEIIKLGLKVDFIPSAATAKKLVKEIPVNKGEKIFIPRSEIAGKGVIEVLKKRNVNVTEIATYSNKPVNYTKEQVEEIFSQNINVVTFTSPSTVENFVKLLRSYKIKLTNQHLVSIGPSTTAAIKKLYLQADATAEEHNIDGLIDVTLSLYQ